MNTKGRKLGAMRDVKAQIYESLCHIWGQPSNLRKNWAESVIKLKLGSPVDIP